MKALERLDLQGSTLADRLTIFLLKTEAAPLLESQGRRSTSSLRKPLRQWLERCDGLTAAQGQIHALHHSSQLGACE